jgi:orotate phosphoribosyltransferase
VQTLTIVDREEGGADAIRAAGVPFVALVRRAELEG